MRAGWRRWAWARQRSSPPIDGLETNRRVRDQLDVSRYVSYAGSGYGVGSVALTFYLVGRASMMTAPAKRDCSALKR